MNGNLLLRSAEKLFFLKSHALEFMHLVDLDFVKKEIADDDDHLRTIDLVSSHLVDDITGRVMDDAVNDLDDESFSDLLYHYSTGEKTRELAMKVKWIY